MLKKIWKYPHLKGTVLIAVVAFAVLIISLCVIPAPWDSILQNVFAGLITGLVVTLIGSLKSKAIKDIEIEQGFLQSIHDQYKTTSQQWIEYRKKRHAATDEFFEEAYELAAEMESIESYIEHRDKNGRLVRILGRKPSEFFERETSYNFNEQKQRHKELYDLLEFTTDQDDKWRKTVDDKINEIRKVHRDLNRGAFNLIGELNEKKIEIETSVP